MNKEDIIERCKPYQVDYMLLGRLKQDCEYFLDMEIDVENSKVHSLCKK